MGCAAAVILSLGDRREGRRNARLRYHGVRIAERQSLTAEVAAYQAGWMGRVDAAVLAHLAARALEAPALAAGGISVEDRLVAEQLARGVDWPGRDAPATGRTTRRWRGCALVAWCAEGPRERFAALYAVLLRLDQTISAAPALELRLIDGIADGRGGCGAEHEAFRHALHACARALWADKMGAEAAFPSFDELEKEQAMATIFQARWDQEIAAARAEGAAQGRELGLEQGRELGRAEERARLRRQATLKFGLDTAERLSDQLASLTTRADLDRVGDWIVECDSVDELLSRLRSIVSRT